MVDREVGEARRIVQRAVHAFEDVDGGYDWCMGGSEENDACSAEFVRGHEQSERTDEDEGYEVLDSVRAGAGIVLTRDGAGEQKAMSEECLPKVDKSASGDYLWRPGNSQWLCCHVNNPQMSRECSRIHSTVERTP